MTRYSREISIDDYLKRFPDSQITRTQLEAGLKWKQAGVPCRTCGEKIWAYGSAGIGEASCFTCLTGEADASGDLEIK
jgi:hypothetical protein